MILAMVVLPTPGGPHRIIDGMFPDWMALRMTPFLPVRCSCPMSSSSFEGLIRSARGGCEFSSTFRMKNDNNYTTGAVKKQAPDRLLFFWRIISLLAQKKR